MQWMSLYGVYYDGANIEFVNILLTVHLETDGRQSWAISELPTHFAFEDHQLVFFSLFQAMS